MPLTALDHVNIRTTGLDRMVRFYGDVLELEPGPRPSFSFNGAWLYCGSNAAIHLVESDRDPAQGPPRIEHFAFRAEGLAAFLERLQGLGITHHTSVVPDLGIRQVHLRDPDGNHIEVARPPAEEAEGTP